MNKIFGKKSLICMLLTLAMTFTVFAFVSNDKINAQAEDTQITGFSSSDVTISSINVNGNFWTTENCTIAQYTGAGFEPYFQDEKFFRFIDGVDSVSGLGEVGNSYVKMSVCPSKVGPDMFVRFAFANEVKVEDIASLKIRAYLKLNATETSETSIQISNLDGSWEGYAVPTYGKEGEWTDIVLSGDALNTISKDGVINGLTIAIRNAQGSGMHQGLHNDWHNFDANPSFIMFDSVSYVVNAVNYNVTYDYNTALTGLENGTAVVKVSPYKVEKPANPVVMGYNFVGWYADAEYTTEFDFDTAISADTTVYAKFEAITLPEGVITNFGQGEVAISTVQVMGNTWTTENCTIAQYTGPGFEDFFQDVKFFRFIEGVDSVSGLGEVGNSYVKMSVCPSKVGTDMYVRFAFINEVKVEDIAGITIRAYLKLNATETSETSIQISNLDGSWEGYAIPTYGKEGEWTDIVLSGDALNTISKDGVINGLTIAIRNAQGSGMHQELHNQWNDFDANPAFIMIDSIVYEEFVASYNVTYDYNTALTGLENGTAIVNSKPFKVTRPVSPVAMGYNFVGWYSDAEYTTEFDFDTAISEDTTVYAKFEDLTFADGVVANFGGNDTAVDKIIVGDSEFAGDVTIDSWTGPGFEAYFPDSKFAKHINGVDTLTSVGEDGADYLKIGLFPDKAFGNGLFRIKFANQVDCAKIAKVVIRVYFKLNSIDGTQVLFGNYYDTNVENYFVVDTFRQEGMWLDIEIKGSDLACILSGETFDGLFVCVKNAVGGAYNSLHNEWNNFDANPCYMYLDSITYEEGKKVTIDDGNGNVQILTVLAGEKVTGIQNPSKESTAQYSYEFAGWYVGDIEFDFDTAITQDITITARYTETIRSYTVSFTGVEEADQTVEYGSNAVKPADPAKEGYTFKGWYVGDVEYTFDEAVVEDITIEAVFEEIVEQPQESTSEKESTSTGDSSSIEESTSKGEESNGGCMGSLGGLGLMTTLMLSGIAILRKRR